MPFVTAHLEIFHCTHSVASGSIPICHWKKKQYVPHYIKIVLRLWRSSGIILELSLPQFCYTSRVLSQCGIVSYCGNSEEIMWNQTLENCGINRFIDYLMVIDTVEILWKFVGLVWNL